ncbi:MAG: hypothetical protein GTO18_21100 [Anaerolineales bacterium]|nr:hypothetical protein [Anaerolineales bacterium]
MNSLKITIFHTNDMHARMEAISRLSSFARRLRHEVEQEDRIVFLWDAGDAADRRERICSITKGAAFSPILNAMGYTLQTMGNAISLPYGPQAMAEVALRADFPILAANLRDGDGPLPDGIQERVLIQLSEDLTMGIFGLTAPWGGIYEIFGFHMPDFLDVARSLVGEMRSQGAALIILLSHLGLEDDRRLAEEVPGIDIIIGGHSHNTLPEGEEVNGVLILQAGDYAQALGRVDLELDPQNGEILSRKAQVFTIPEDESPDPHVTDAILAAEHEVDELMARPIGVLQSALNLDHFNECGIGNLTADALRERLGADIAIISCGQFHAGLPEGEITLGHLDSACFSSANPCLSTIRGEQIIQALEHGLDPSIYEYMHHAFRGTPVGVPQVSGMTIEYDPNGETGERVIQVNVQGESIEPERLYKVAHTDAETQPEYGYLSVEEDQSTETEVPTIVREAIEDYIRQHSPVAEPTTGRLNPQV